MPAIDRNLKQPVTYWSATPSGYGGYTYGSPVVMLGRWEDKREIFRTQAGDEAVSNAVAYLKEDVAEGGYLYNGESEASNPSVLPGAYQIKKFTRIPDLRQVAMERKAYM